MSQTEGVVRHYGVRGMKWGVRKSTSGSSGSSSKKRAKKPPTKAQAAARAKVLERRKATGKRILKTLLIASGGVVVGAAGEFALVRQNQETLDRINDVIRQNEAIVLQGKTNTVLRDLSRASSR